MFEVDITTLILPFVLAIVLYRYLFRIRYDDNLQCGLRPRAVWDVTGLKHELQMQVQGQEAAVCDVLRLLRRATNNPLRAQPVLPQPRTQVVFLLGGPGVGKSFILDIVSKHVKIETPYNIQDVKFVPKPISKEFGVKRIEIQNYEYISGTVISTIELGICIDHYIKYKKDKKLANLLIESVKNCRRSSWFDRSIIFVTVPIFSEKALEKLQNVTKYEEHVAAVADELEDYVMCHVPEIHVSFITFNPLSFQTFEEIVREQRLNQRVLRTLEKHPDNQVIFDEEYILPRGCKTDHEDLKLLLE